MRKSRPVLVWDQWNREHIKKHNLTVEEVVEGYKNEFLRTKTTNRKILLFGRIRSGRVLTIVLSYKYQHQPYVVSARDMSKSERKLYLYVKNNEKK